VLNRKEESSHEYPLLTRPRTGTTIVRSAAGCLYSSGTCAGPDHALLQDLLPLSAIDDLGADLGMFIGATLLALGYQIFMCWVANNPETQPEGSDPQSIVRDQRWMV
jgi:hypothetical protein